MKEIPVKEYHSRINRVTISCLALLVASGLFAPYIFAADGDFEFGFSQLLPIHIAAMSLSGASILTGGLIARYRKNKSKNWLKQHKAFQWSGAVLGLLGIATAVTMVEVSTEMHLNVTHSIVAVISFSFIVLAIIAAYVFLKKKKHKKEFRITHRWLGRITIVAWLITIAFGLFTPLAGIF
jgi:uncharacterized membrane protein YozB (DUF420 family)